MNADGDIDIDWRYYLDEVDQDLALTDKYEEDFVDDMLKRAEDKHYAPNENQMQFLMKLYERLT